MEEHIKTKLVALSEKWGSCVVRGSSLDEQAQQLAEAAAALDLQSYIGSISHAGQVADGTLQVQFNVFGNGYSSRWRQWAYEPALQSLLHKKKVWVICDGLPFGDNLLQVLIFQQDL